MKAKCCIIVFSGLYAVLNAGYQVPEIWLAPDDPARARAAATELGAAGCRVTVAPGEDLRDLPAEVPVEAVWFTDAGLVAALDRRPQGRCSGRGSPSRRQRSPSSWSRSLRRSGT